MNENPTILVMPDLFIDRLVKLTGPFKNFKEAIEACYGRGGGNVFGNQQEIVLGGNAANLARALGSLSVKTTLITVTNEFGLSLAQSYLSNLPVKIINYHVERAPMTVALEFIDEEQGTSRNVMISDAGDLRNLDISRFIDNFRSIIQNHQIIAIVNQASNDRYIELVQSIHELSAENARIFLDFADLSSRSPSFINHLAESLFDLPKVEWIGLNENECHSLSKNLLSMETATTSEEKLIEEVTEISQRFPRPFWLLHTARFSLAAKNGEVIAKSPAFRLRRITRTTGAGDTWNAGLIAAISQKKSNLQQALQHANAIAGFFIQENRFPRSRAELRAVFS